MAPNAIPSLPPPPAPSPSPGAAMSVAVIVGVGEGDAFGDFDGFADADAVGVGSSSPLEPVPGDTGLLFGLTMTWPHIPHGCSRGSARPSGSKLVSAWAV